MSEKEQKEVSEEKLTARQFFNLSEMWHYFFRKKGEQPKGDFNLRTMHFINKFSILVFLCGVIYLIIKNVIL